MRDILREVAPQIQTIIASVIGSTVFNRQITYRHYQGKGVFDAALGHPSSVFTDYPDVDAARVSHSAKSAAALSSQIEAGDTLYLVQPSSLATILDSLSLKDSIVDAGVECQITHISELSGFAIFLTCKRSS
jgi:hypothetical protein